MGNLLYHMATRFKGSKERASTLIEYISSNKITTEQQLTGSHSNGVVMATVCRCQCESKKCAILYISFSLPPSPFLASMEFMKSNPVEPLNKESFEASCGVGVVITRDQIAEKVGTIKGF